MGPVGKRVAIHNPHDQVRVSLLSRVPLEHVAPVFPTRGRDRPDTPMRRQRLLRIGAGTHSLERFAPAFQHSMFREPEYATAGIAWVQSDIVRFHTSALKRAPELSRWRAPLTRSTKRSCQYADVLYAGKCHTLVSTGRVLIIRPSFIYSRKLPLALIPIAYIPEWNHHMPRSPLCILFRCSGSVTDHPRFQDADSCKYTVAG